MNIEIFLKLFMHVYVRFIFNINSMMLKKKSFFFLFLFVKLNDMIQIIEEEEKNYSLAVEYLI